MCQEISPQVIRAAYVDESVALYEHCTSHNRNLRRDPWLIFDMMDIGSKKDINLL